MKLYFAAMAVLAHYSSDVVDGVVHMGSVTASPPANPDGREKLEMSE